MELPTPTPARAKAPQGTRPPLRIQMMQAQRVRRHQPYGGLLRAPGQVPNNLNVNIFDNQAVVNVEGGDRFEPPDYGPVRMQDLNVGRDLIPLRPQHIPVPDDDEDHFFEDERQEEDSDEMETIAFDEDQNLLAREDQHPYPTDFDELVATPDHLDWSSRLVHLHNSQQFLTWDACYHCGMYVVNRWCTTCHRPVCFFHAVAFQRPPGPQDQPLATLILCRNCVETNWEHFLDLVGYGGLLSRPGPAGRASSYGF
eukprot:3793039-Amphidinium_carterae.1